MHRDIPPTPSLNTFMNNAWVCMQECMDGFAWRLYMYHPLVRPRHLKGESVRIVDQVRRDQGIQPVHAEPTERVMCDDTLWRVWVIHHGGMRLSWRKRRTKDDISHILVGQAVVGSIVWTFRRLKKPRCREMSARGYALHSVCPKFSLVRRASVTAKRLTLGPGYPGSNLTRALCFFILGRDIDRRC